MRYPETGGYQTHAKVAESRESCARDDSSFLNRRQGASPTNRLRSADGVWAQNPTSACSSPQSLSRGRERRCRAGNESAGVSESTPGEQAVDINAQR
jgi:hypothetical protein